MDKTIDKIARLEFELEALRNCQHQNSRIRVKTATNNTKMYCWQCLNCGRVLKKTDGKTWLPKDTITDIERVEPFDEGLSNTHSEMVSLLFKRLSAAKWEASQESFWTNTLDIFNQRSGAKKGCWF